MFDTAFLWDLGSGVLTCLQQCNAVALSVCLSIALPQSIHTCCRDTMMLRRAKRAAIFASPVVAVGVWAGLVLKDRRETPPDVRFSIGSAGTTA